MADALTFMPAVVLRNLADKLYENWNYKLD